MGTRPPYQYEREHLRRVPADMLVAIGAARYSVPVEYVGRTVSIQETTTHYDIFHEQTCIARHAKAPDIPSSWITGITRGCSVQLAPP